MNPVAASSYLSGSYPHPARFLTGYGGHIMVMQNGIARLSSVELRRMGQTNMLGRYPFHLHRLGARGKHSFIEDSAIWRSFYRGVSVHATSGARLSRNVAYDVIGHCYYLEDGSEEGNTFEYNLGAHVHFLSPSPNIVRASSIFQSTSPSCSSISLWIVILRCFFFSSASRFFSSALRFFSSTLRFCVSSC